ncbi:MAG: hypothetical protein WBI40_07715 [Methylococcaceae bacterium]
MNPENEIFETCDSNQTEIEQHTKAFERCNSNQIKIGRGGARKNSGKKSSGIETVTVRIDKQLLNTVTAIKNEFKAGKSLDDIFSKPAPKNDNVKLLIKIAKLEREKDEIRDTFFKLLKSRDEDHAQEISKLNSTIESLNSVVIMLKKALQATKDAMPHSTGKVLDEKLRKRLIQFCHPDLIQDPRKKAIAEDLTKALNGLAK